MRGIRGVDDSGASVKLARSCDRWMSESYQEGVIIVLTYSFLSLRNALRLLGKVFCFSFPLIIKDRVFFQLKYAIAFS